MSNLAVVNRPVSDPDVVNGAVSDPDVVKKLMSDRAEVKRVVSDIVQSPEDKRLYRGLELTNGLKAVLISDPTADFAAAALDVHVGSLSDPANIPGLAHFCEHMLFLGTEKYPQENEYNQFLSEHGGISNAFTSEEHTNFHFDVSHEHLQGALDRFAQFFLCPLFDESCKNREVNAVDSEHQSNLMDDGSRLCQLNKATCNPDHPYSKFNTGNKSTLETIPSKDGIDVRQELLKFHSTFYSSNIMGLCVLGRESLDELTSMVVGLFGKVENKNVPAPVFPDDPFREEHLRQILKVVPITDFRGLYMTFPIPDLTEFKTKFSYLGLLVGHTAPGGLLSELKAEGWVNTLFGELSGGARGYAFFVITVDLTEDGLLHVEDIIFHVFQYIQKLRTEGPQEWLFQECKGLNEVAFRFQEKEQCPQSYVSKLAGFMHYCPLEEVLAVEYLLKDFDPSLIETVLDKLRPENIRVTVVSKSFEGQTDRIEEWYGTRYKQEAISNEVIQKWANANPSDKFKLPVKNEFIPNNFEIYPLEKDSQTFPTLIKDTALSKVWFKKDDKFFLPNACLCFQLRSPFVYMSPLHANMTWLYLELLEEAVKEFAYAAALAGLNYELRQTFYGMSLCVLGYNDKQDMLLKKIIETMGSLEIDEKHFDIHKESLARALSSFEAQQPQQHAAYYLDRLMTDGFWTNDEYRSALEDVTLARLKVFVAQLLSRLHIEALLHGNITKERALGLVEMLENTLIERAHTKPLLPSQLTRYRQVQIPDGGWYVYQRKNEVHSNCAVAIYYQTGMKSTHDNALLGLFCQIIREPCFDTLRTKEQLGYHVSRGPHEADGVQGLYFIVQSEKAPHYLERRVEAFLRTMETSIEEMSEDTFQKHIDALAALKMDMPKMLAVECAEYWEEIKLQEYNFDRANIEVSYLKTLTKKQLLLFYRELLAVDAPRRRKVAVHILSKDTESCPIMGEFPTQDDVDPSVGQFSTEDDADLAPGQFPTQDDVDPSVGQFSTEDDADLAPGQFPTQDDVELSPAPSLPQPTLVQDMTEFKKSLPLFPPLRRPKA